jgi:two-component system response regulator CpxR
MVRLLVINGDRGGWGPLTDYLTSAGFQVVYALDGESGFERALWDDFDLILLGSMLPDGNGFELLGRLTTLVSKPIIVVAEGGDEVDMIVSLEMGADDYLVKPVKPRELIARIKAVLRRAGSGADAETSSHPNMIKVGDIEMDTGARIVNRCGEQVVLTSVEFGLLLRLLRNAGKLVSRENLTKEVLGRSLSHSDRSIDVHVSKLRKKLGDDAKGTCRIRTIRGEGYLYALPPLSEPDISRTNLNHV